MFSQFPGIVLDMSVAPARHRFPDFDLYKLFFLASDVPLIYCLSVSLSVDCVQGALSVGLTQISFDCLEGFLSTGVNFRLPDPCALAPSSCSSKGLSALVPGTFWRETLSSCVLFLLTTFSSLRHQTGNPHSGSPIFMVFVVV